MNVQLRTRAWIATYLVVDGDIFGACARHVNIDLVHPRQKLHILLGCGALLHRRVGQFGPDLEQQLLVHAFPRVTTKSMWRNAIKPPRGRLVEGRQPDSASDGATQTRRANALLPERWTVKQPMVHDTIHLHTYSM